jgi:lipoprotein-anchoring transpeptidase ErfK/SrfK
LLIRGIQIHPAVFLSEVCERNQDLNSKIGWRLSHLVSVFSGRENFFRLKLALALDLWLNQGMSKRHRHKLPASRGGSGGIFLGLFVCFVLGIAVVVWCASGKKPNKQTARKNPSVNSVAKVTSQALPKAMTKAQHLPPAHQPAPVVKTEFISPPAPSKITKPVIEQKKTREISPTEFPRRPCDTLEAQIALARVTISSGSIDGVNGSQTRAALLVFQRGNNLSPTGELDIATRAALTLDSAPLTHYVITSNDLARLQPVRKTWLGKSQQTALDYETILEFVAEKGHASPKLTKKLNPGANWTNIVAGDEVKIPAVEYPSPKTKAAFIVISLAERRLQAFDENTNLLAHFPCSIAAKFEKRPVGELHVKAIAPNPDYTFNPEVFAESQEARQLKTKLILPPGPNNPVGTAWISLDKPGYGIHGTPSPEQVGRTESHGCFRLANWNAEYLIQLVTVGVPVRVEP